MTTAIDATTQLNNGLEMPWLGLGVYQMTDAQQLDRAVKTALDLGYRSVDTAAVYGNEAEVGQALQDSGVAREEIFLTTKVWNDEQRAGNTAAAFEASLDRLKTDYVDLYLIHWPVKGHYLETWKAMEEIYASGRAKAVGVSNFLVHHLEDIFGASELVPMVNQIEFHPHLVQPELLAFCKDKGVQVEAWSPLMQGQVATEPTIGALAEKYRRTPAQIVLRWDLQHQVVTIPKSVTPSRIEENAGLFDFELSAEDMASLDALDATRRLGPDPDTFGF